MAESERGPGTTAPHLPILALVAAPPGGADGTEDPGFADRLATALDDVGFTGACLALAGLRLAEALERRRIPYCFCVDATAPRELATPLRRPGHLRIAGRPVVFVRRTDTTPWSAVAATLRRTLAAVAPLHLVAVDDTGELDPYGAGFDAACDAWPSAGDAVAGIDQAIDEALRRAPTDHPRYRVVFVPTPCAEDDARRLEYWLAEALRATRLRAPVERLLLAALPGFPAAAPALLDAAARAVGGRSTEPGLFLEGERYRGWTAQRAFGPEVVQAHLDHLAPAGPPAFVLVVLFDGVSRDALATTITAAAGLDYPDTRVLVVAPTPSLFGPDNARLAWLQCGADPLADLNAWIRQQPADDWVWLLAAGDRLAPRALLSIGAAIADAPGPSILSCDDELDDGAGTRTPRFKPASNLDLLRSSAYVGRAACASAEAIVAAGGLAGASVANAVLELLLKTIEAHGPTVVGHVADVLLTVSAEGTPGPAEIADRRRILAGHLARLGLPAEPLDGYVPGTFRLAFRHPRRPLVSIVIPTRDQLPLLRRCIETVVETTAYENYEIIVVDNDSQTPEARAYLDQLALLAPERIRILAYAQPFNFAAMNNRAAAIARGEYLLLLNNDTAVLHPDWLDVMVGHAQRPEVGVVGARLLYQDGTLQHAGVVLGLCGCADHLFTHSPIEGAGAPERALLEQNFSAVTGACMLVRKSVYDELGGLDEERFKVWLNDIDFCLRAGEAGYLVVWTPHATLLHDGSASLRRPEIEARSGAERQAREIAERDAFTRRWIGRMGRDPAYNPNLTLKRRHGQIETDPVITWNPLPWNPRPRLLAMRADQAGCSHYRVMTPLRALSASGAILGMATTAHYEPAEIERIAPDVIVLQRQTRDAHQAAIRRYRDYAKALRIFEIDDLITDFPKHCAHRVGFDESIGRRLRESIALCDRLVVSTKALAEAYGPWAAEVRVAANHLERAAWAGLTPRRRRGPRARVGWAGGGGHDGDLEMIAEVVRELAGEVDWVFMGMCPDVLRPYVREFHDWSPIVEYPVRLAALDLDLAIAPLTVHPFNEAKSNIKVLEYGALGYPLICSDIEPYRDPRFPVERVCNRRQDWVRVIRERAHDLDAAARCGDLLRAAVDRHGFIEDHINEWRHAWSR